MDIKFDILERSNSGEGDWVEVTIVVVCGGGVELEGVEEAMDCGFDTMWDKEKAWSFNNGEKTQKTQRKKLGRELCIFYSSLIIISYTYITIYSLQLFLERSYLTNSNNPITEMTTIHRKYLQSIQNIWSSIRWNRASQDHA